MAWIVLVVLIGAPIVEIWVLIEIGGEIGAIPTIALIVATAVLGTFLFRIQGMATLARARAHLERNEMPVGELLSGLGLLLAGVLLLVPGFVTDAVGLLLFIPPLRRGLITLLVTSALARGIRINRVAPGAGPGDRPGHTPGRGPTIDGDFTEVRETNVPESAADGAKPADSDQPSSRRLDPPR
ncbi:MAG: FxsA family protein [Alphaproteobacteria bacterium]|nr:FxsA family protein [Alphaproteobacteria bacterium]